jgi:hypothetical protein
VGAGSADGDLVGFLLGRRGAHGQTSIFQHYGGKRELID